MSEYKTLYLSERDNVAVALSEIPENASVVVQKNEIKMTVQVLEPIRFGHKFAVRPIHKQKDIIKYGEVIGAALEDIQTGAHVHIHNLEGKRGRGDKIAN